MESELNGYLTRTAEFLLGLSWAWDFKMTHIHLQQVPRTFGHPSSIRSGFVQRDVDDIHAMFQACEIDMREISKRAELLVAEGEGYRRCWKWIEAPVIETKGRPRKWKDKKYKEVAYFSQFICQELSEEKPDVYIDVGAGMGYLSSTLAVEGIKVIAVEGNEKMSVVDDETPVDHVKMRLTSSMKSELEGLTRWNDRVCLVGLHACGSLTSNALRTFVEDERYCSLIFVPCCYHKIDSRCDFPMSNCVKKSEFPYSIYFLRLASQKKDLETRGGMANEFIRVYSRAVFQIKVSNTVESFDEVFKSILDQEQKQLLLGLHAEKKEDLLQSIVRILLVQSKIERLAELFVLLDRLEFLREVGVEGEVLSGVIPFEVSPRGEVIVCRRRK